MLYIGERLWFGCSKGFGDVYLYDPSKPISQNPCFQGFKTFSESLSKI
jgi:hypothetical protein